MQEPDRASTAISWPHECEKCIGQAAYPVYDANEAVLRLPNWKQDVDLLDHWRSAPKACMGDSFNLMSVASLAMPSMDHADARQPCEANDCRLLIDCLERLD